ncbi:hypothetical protein WJX79_006767 [Trebouxia sp. C0005]
MPRTPSACNHTHGLLNVMHQSVFSSTIQRLRSTILYEIQKSFARLQYPDFICHDRKFLCVLPISPIIYKCQHAWPTAMVICKTLDETCV